MRRFRPHFRPCSNVLIGEISDRMAEIGGTSILSETTEFIGAEHILAKRGKDERVSQRIYQIVHDYENAIRLVGHDVREGNPSPGNMEGGLTTLEEKSLGCIHKAAMHRSMRSMTMRNR